MKGASINMTLYHAHWCGHCVSFLPLWDKLKSELANSNNKLHGVPIKFESFEESKLKKGGANINGKPISGYPTIKLTLSVNGATKDYEYTGDRKDIMNYLKELTYGIEKKLKK